MKKNIHITVNTLPFPYCPGNHPQTSILSWESPPDIHIVLGLTPRHPYCPGNHPQTSILALESPPDIHIGPKLSYFNDDEINCILD